MTNKTEQSEKKPYWTGPSRRPRRMRRNEAIRALVQEVHLSPNQLIWPIFVTEIEKEPTEIKSLPGVFRLPETHIVQEVQNALKLGLKHIMLFPVIHPSKKNPQGTESLNENGLMQRTIRLLKRECPEAILYADVALDPYTSHGHDGIVDSHNYVINDETVLVLREQSCSYARCGVDFVCPSDMMDGRIGAIREALDAQGFVHTAILAYSAKFASAFYGPFREAVGSGAQNLDKKTYQLSCTNPQEALREAQMDVEEGADMIMVKPGLPYLDILALIKQTVSAPLAVYQVSGEYSMLKMGAQQGLFDEKRAVWETFVALKRAGADAIITYYAKWACEHLF
jgi:porphobilinogen synthase